jgi:O-antigen/teichoic acid export membrane protein
VATTKINILANFFGQAWYALLGFLSVPWYIHLMGIEAYGVIGLSAMLQALFSVLDLGLSPALNRALASRDQSESAGAEIRDLVRSFELGYWVIGLLIGAAVLIGAPAISRWVHPEHLSATDLLSAVRLMGVLLFLQWPLTLYQGGLLGLERHVTLNLVNGSLNLVRTAGAVLLLTFYSATVITFLTWQVLVSAVHIGILVRALWKHLPASRVDPLFRRPLLAQNARFAAGIGLTSILALFFRQADKLVLSRVLPLTTFGYYMLAVTVANMLGVVMTPILNVMFPRFSALVGAGKIDQLRLVYHQACQLICVAVVPVGLLGAIYGSELLRIWTRDPAAASFAGPVLSVLLVGTILNALLGLPYDLQVAFGWTSLGLIHNLIAVVVLVPAMVVLAIRQGMLGAASIWVVYNALGLLVLVPVMHMRILRGELRRWAWSDVAKPIFAIGTVCLVLRVLVPTAQSTLVTLVQLTLFFASSLLAGLLATDLLRPRVLSLLSTVRPAEL